MIFTQPEFWYLASSSSSVRVTVTVLHLVTVHAESFRLSPAGTRLQREVRTNPIVMFIASVRVHYLETKTE